MSKVSYDHRAITIDGKRTLILAGAMHYPRSTPSMWPELMRKTKAAGLNTVETYVFWNLHERQRGVYDFSGRLDLRLWCELAAAEGLKVILRIGPYVCAETNFGGLPPWLREVGGMQTRTWNAPFMREMEKWCRLLVDYLRPMFAPAGGPIVMAQFENEFNNVKKLYKADGQRYLQWCVQLADSLNLGVPLVMCCGGAKGAVETINAFYAHLQVASHHREHPDQPALWTEFYTGWYNTWGYANQVRKAQDVAYALARFVAAGGVGMNYFMWHGGTNFDRDSMYLQTTSYEFDGPLDEYGLETTKYHHLTRLHKVLGEYADVLLAQDPPAPKIIGGTGSMEGTVQGTGGGGSTMEKLGAPVQSAWTYKSGKRRLTFLCNDDAASEAKVEFDGRRFNLAPQSVVILGDGKVLYNSARVKEGDVVTRAMKPALRTGLEFEAWVEPLPEDWPSEVAPLYESHTPVEQLQLTQDRSDYCWYQASMRIAPKDAGRRKLTFTGAADVLYVYIDGKRVASTPTPLEENRNLQLYDIEVDAMGFTVDTRDMLFTQEFQLDLPAGEHELAVLCNAMGLIKGEWMLGMYNMVNERKGLWGEVLWNGKKIKGPWLIMPGLLGEHLGAYAAPAALLTWKDAAMPFKGMRWLRASFELPKTKAPLALDLGGMTKGMIYLNGDCVSRYWTLPATGLDITSRYRDNVINEFSTAPTQRYYHLPPEWLDDMNTLVLLEEVGGDPRTIRVVQRV